jgi:predicted enzyme related to lactoylglutathione lyase
MAGFGKYPIAAVLRAEDLGRAREFYTDVMGFSVDEKFSGEGMVYLAAGEGTMVLIYERPGMPAPANTTLGIGLPDADFDGCVEYVRSKGVMLEEYDVPEMGLKTVNGVAVIDGMKSAWFKDTEGNIINVASM